MKSKLHIVLGLIGLLFGIMTVKTGASSLFTEAGQLAAGDYVPFVLWFNFLAGFFYIITSVGILMRRPWAVRLAKILALSTATIFVVFLGHVALGGAYEIKTLIALIFRGTFWTIAWRLLRARS